VTYAGGRCSRRRSCYGQNAWSVTKGGRLDMFDALFQENTKFQLARGASGRWGGGLQVPNYGEGSGREFGRRRWIHQVQILRDRHHPGSSHGSSLRNPASQTPWTPRNKYTQKQESHSTTNLNAHPSITADRSVC
jgi:hypothetical protein